MVKFKTPYMLLFGAMLLSCAQTKTISRPEVEQAPDNVVIGDQSQIPTDNVETIPFEEDEIVQMQEVTKPAKTHNVPHKPSSPAVMALISDAENKSRAGNLESAVVTIERALRLEPRNPALVYKLAELRLQQEKPRLAEDLARKSVLLSGNNNAQKQAGWLLIAKARRAQGNAQGALDAQRKAAGYD